MPKFKNLKNEMNTKTKIRQVNEEIDTNDKNFNQTSITDYTDVDKVANGNLTTVVDAMLNTLPDQIKNAGARQAGITANVANLYEAKGNYGLPLVGNEIPENLQIDEGNNLFSHQLFTDIQDVEIPATKDNVKSGNSMADSVKSMLSGVFNTSKHNFMGIDDLLKDDSLMTKQWIYMLQDILSRSQATALTQNKIFDWKPLEAVINGQNVEISPAIYLTFMDMVIGDALTPLAQLLNSMTDIAAMRGTYSRTLASISNTNQQDLNRRAFLGKIASLFRQMRNFARIDTYSDDMSTTFNGYAKKRDGRFDAVIFHTLYNYCPGVDISDKEGVVIPKEKFNNVFINIQNLMLSIYSWLWHVNLNSLKVLFNDATTRKDGIATASEVENLIVVLSDSLLDLSSYLVSYYEFRTNAVSSGLFGDLKAHDYTNEQYSKLSNGMFPFLSQVRLSKAESTDVGILIEFPVDLENVTNFMCTANISAFYEEVDHNDKLMHLRLIDPSASVVAVTCYNVIHTINYPIVGLDFEDYIPTVTTRVMLMPNGTLASGNVQYTYQSLWPNSILQAAPIFFYERASSTSKNQLSKRSLLGLTKMLTPSLIELLIKYYEQVLPGADITATLGVTNIER